MHTTAHPDDEHGGVLAQLSRGQGARVSLLTLNRGESGDNAIGSELFDAVGLIRTEELLMAGRYYGLDRQYFTTVIDYGFSKRLDETLEKWGREPVLRDVVRIIRRDRPFVLIARFQGNERDGHGNHQAAGLITQDAFKAAADPTMFPEAGCVAVAGAQALHGRRSRERGLDAADRHRRLQPVARRFVSELLARGPQLSAIAERRAVDDADRGRRTRTTSACVGDRRAAEGTVVLRRHRHDDPWFVQSHSPAGACRRRPRCSRRSTRRSKPRSAPSR